MYGKYNFLSRFLSLIAIDEIHRANMFIVIIFYAVSIKSGDIVPHFNCSE